MVNGLCLVVHVDIACPHQHQYIYYLKQKREIEVLLEPRSPIDITLYNNIRNHHINYKPYHFSQVYVCERIYSLAPMLNLYKARPILGYFKYRKPIGPFPLIFVFIDRL